MRINFRKSFLILVLIFWIQFIISLHLTFNYSNLYQGRICLSTTYVNNSCIYRVVRGNSSSHSSLLDLEKYGLSKGSIRHIERTLENYFPTHFSKSEEVTLELAWILDKKGLDVAKVLKPVVDTMASLSQKRIGNFIKNKTAVKYLIQSISEGKYGVKENPERLLLKLIEDGEKNSLGGAKHFRKNLRTLGAVTEENSSVAEVLKLAQIKVGKVIEDISDIATILADGRPNKYRNILLNIPLRGLCINLEEYKKLIKSEELAPHKIIKIGDKKYVPVLKGRLGLDILKTKNYLHKSIKLAGGNLEHFNPDKFDFDQLCKNLDSIKYFSYKLIKEGIEIASLLEVSAQQRYHASMKLTSIERRSQLFRKSLTEVREKILALKAKLDKMDIGTDRINMIFSHQVPDMITTSKGIPKLFEEYLQSIVLEHVNRKVGPEEIEKIIKSRAGGIKAIILDLNGTITSLFKRPDKEMRSLLSELSQKNIPVAILTTAPWLAKFKLGKDFYIGKKENISDFMKEYNLEPKDLAIVANDYLGPDKTLLENAPGALAFNVGKISLKLPSNLISSEQRGPQATKEILTQILNLLTENE